MILGIWQFSTLFSASSLKGGLLDTSSVVEMTFMFVSEVNYISKWVPKGKNTTLGRSKKFTHFCYLMFFSV